MAQKQVSQLGVRSFISALAGTLPDFRDLPLDDRDTDWILRRLQQLLNNEMLRMDLQSRDKHSLSMLFQRLQWYMFAKEMRVDYQDDPDHE